jgi:hypothetical protein
MSERRSAPFASLDSGFLLEPTKPIERRKSNDSVLVNAPERGSRTAKSSRLSVRVQQFFVIRTPTG